LNHPSEKYARQIGSFPQVGMNKIHICTCNHPVKNFTLIISIFVRQILSSMSEPKHNLSHRNKAKQNPFFFPSVTF